MTTTTTNQAMKKVARAELHMERLEVELEETRRELAIALARGQELQDEVDELRRAGRVIRKRVELAIAGIDRALALG